MSVPETSSKHSSNSDDDDDDFGFPDYVHIILLSNDKLHVLMLKTDDDWHLPYFEYPKSLDGDVNTLSQDLQRALHISSIENTCFTIVQELLGDYGSNGVDENGEVGFAQLYLVECHLDHLALPSNASWKDAEFLSIALKDEAEKRSEIGDILDILLGILHVPSSIDCIQRDPRYRFGWFDKASKWLIDAASRDGREIVGRVFQEGVSCTSTILKVNTTSGWLFLKCPALGVNESSITPYVCSLFPESTPHIVEANSDLNCFVSKGFDHVTFDESHSRGIVMEMAQIQVASISHLETLKAAGCQVRGPEQLAKKIEEWLQDEIVKRALSGGFKKFKKLAPELISACSQLMKSKIPLTLIHGDLSQDNATLKEGDNKKYLLFDWQYACISHPFMDLHCMWRDIDRKTLEEYLNVWSNFAGREDSDAAIRIAPAMGWCLKMWTMFDCIKESDLERNSSLAEFAWLCLSCAEDCLSQEAVVPY
eukprot:Plantae.Rhodophyta-Hildenbrandia_rubra.ctg13518.p1 GENE.Plantae.Rhodophyta-Hildenbrandia_rubra.ctg13518~~Plantae.Rhodophyta-Hildenbrandia_rubra.ctg13518.p1  ORF type:complete len:480 (+),score=56.28 Plantae.Rhodophyta-Hildenbrandia_rubra.ctg13518:922-2361(+)